MSKANVDSLGIAFNNRHKVDKNGNAKTLLQSFDKSYKYKNHKLISYANMNTAYGASIDKRV